MPHASSSSRPVQWRCEQCSAVNGDDRSSCRACGTSKASRRPSRGARTLAAGFARLLTLAAPQRHLCYS